MVYIPGMKPRSNPYLNPKSNGILRSLMIEISNSCSFFWGGIQEKLASQGFFVTWLQTLGVVCLVKWTTLEC